MYLYSYSLPGHLFLVDSNQTGACNNGKGLVGYPVYIDFIRKGR